MSPTLSDFTGLFSRPQLLSLIGLFWGTFANAQIHQYRVALDDKLREAQVEICFDGQPADYLMADYKKATRNLIEFPQVSRVKEHGHIEFQGRFWKTSQLPHNACINYRVDISRHLSRKRAQSQQSPLINFQSDNTWLWLPENFDKGESAEIEFILPPDMQISTPWKRLDQSKQRYLIGKTPHDWGFTFIVGNFDSMALPVSGGGQLNLALLTGVKNRAELIRWLVKVAGSLNAYLGGNAFEQLQVILMQSKRQRKSPVPWGDIRRGGGTGVRFVVSSDLPIESFYQDWTASHEFSHILLPKLGQEDRWLSEGLASYLQYLLMAQAGQISEREAWQRLYLGLKRGEEGAQKLSNKTLNEIADGSAYRGGSAAIMRIYWSGAAYFLLADWQLRQASDNRQGLPQVLLKLAACCRESPQIWDGKMLSGKLDQIAGSSIFSKLYQEIAFSEEFPDFRQALSGLGVEVDSDGVELVAGDKGKIRRAILSPSGFD